MKVKRVLKLALRNLSLILQAIVPQTPCLQQSGVPVTMQSLGPTPTD